MKTVHSKTWELYAVYTLMAMFRYLILKRHMCSIYSLCGYFSPSIAHSTYEGIMCQNRISLMPRMHLLRVDLTHKVTLDAIQSLNKCKDRKSCAAWFSSCGLCRHLVAVYRSYSKQIDPTAVEVRLLQVKGCITDAGWTYWTLRVNTPFKFSFNRYFARSNPPKLFPTDEDAQYTFCMILIYSLSIRGDLE